MKYSLQPIIHRMPHTQTLQTLSHWDEHQLVSDFACETPQTFAQPPADDLEALLNPLSEEIIPQASGLTAHSRRRVSSRIFLL